MEDINVTIHQQLKEYAQRLFTATVNAYTTDGKCSLKPGKYSAKEMQRENFMKIHEINTGHALTPEEISEDIIVTAGEFSATFMYRDIFVILARWEAMMKPGKDKAVFEIGDIEIISAKVLTDEKTELGTYKEKRMKLQRIHGNWYAPARIKRDAYNVEIYYKHDNLIFCGGKMPANRLNEQSREYLIKTLDKTEGNLTVSLLDLAERNEYFAEVCKRMNIEAQQPATPAEAPQISTESVEAVNVSAEGEKGPREAKCRLVPMRIAHKRLSNGATPFCFNLYPDGSFNIALELNGKIIQVSKAEFRQLWNDAPEPPQPPKSAPQSRKTAPAVNYATPTPKERRIARERHCRRFGANGYAMLDDAAATLAAINTPQHLTANSPPIGRPQLTPYW